MKKIQDQKRNQHNKNEKGKHNSNRNRQVQRKICESDIESTTTAEDELIDYGNTSSDISLEDREAEEDAPMEIEEPTTQQKITTKEAKLEMPKLTRESEGKYFAVYYTEPRVTYYWGKVLRTFSIEEGEVSEVELNFLKKKTIGSDPKDWS